MVFFFLGPVCFFYAKDLSGSADALFVAVSFSTVSVLSKPTCCVGVLCSYHYTVLRMKGLKKKTNVIIVVLGPQDIHQVLMTLIQGGVEYPDPVVSSDFEVYNNIIHT